MKEKQKSVLMISAHADDHTTCAGTLLKLKDQGYDVYEVLITSSGEGRDYRKGDTAHDVEQMRDEELSAASQFLGVKETYRLHQEDLGLNYTKELIFQIVPIVRKIKPTVGIILDTFDWHPDHREAGRLGSEVFKWAATGVKPELGSPWRTPIVLTSEGMLPTKPSILVDVTEYAQKKLELWKIYESQARPQAINFTESLMYVRGYHLRRPGSLMAEAFRTDATSPIILFD